MTQAGPRSETQLDVRKFLHQEQQSEIQYRREREHRVFTWSSSILSVLIGLLLVTKQTAPVWKAYGIWGNAVASLVVLLIVIYATRWRSRNERFRGQNAQVISRIDHLLHCFDKGYFKDDETALFLTDWGRLRLQRPGARLAPCTEAAVRGQLRLGDGAAGRSGSRHDLAAVRPHASGQRAIRRPRLPIRIRLPVIRLQPQLTRHNI